MRRKEIVESQSEKKNSMKSQESSSKSYLERAKNGVGIAFAGALKAAEVTMKGATVILAVQEGLGLDRAQALSQPNASDTALSLRGNDKTTKRHLGIDQKELLHSSNQTDLGHSLRNITPEELNQMGVKNPERFLQNRQKLDQNLQQRAQKRAQRQKMRLHAEKAQEDPKVLERLRKLFKEMPEQASSKTDRRKLNVPLTPCLQWDLATSTVTGTVIPIGTDGTALQVVYKLRVQNICSDPVDSMQYTVANDWTCPTGCVKTSDINSHSFDGLPTSIGQNQFSAGISNDKVYCVQDNNGEPVDVAPDSVTTAVYASGQQKGSMIYSPQVTFEVLP